MQLLLVRHGRPDLSGRPEAGDPPLSADGERQAAAAAVLLAEAGVDRLVASGLRRARATAEPLARRLGLEIETNELVGEIDRVCGRYASVETVRQRGSEHWQRFLADPIGYFGADGERFRIEVLDGFRQLLHRGGGDRVAVFTHGFPINILLAHALGFSEMTRFIPYYGSVTRLAGRSLDRLTVLSVNETGHLDPVDRAAALGGHGQ